MVRKLGNTDNINYGTDAEIILIKNIQKQATNFLKEIVLYPFGKYGVDLKLIFADGWFCYADVERRANWTTNDFPFDTINIPYRKKELLLNHLPLIYFILRGDCRKCLIINGVDILNSDIVENDNKFSTSKEKFFSVSVDKILRYVELDII